MCIQEPYIGVTGFTRPEQVRAALAAFPEGTRRRLMVGVLVSSKSLRGIPLDDRRQALYPSPSMIRPLFLGDPRVLNLIHFNQSRDLVSRLLDDLVAARVHSGDKCHGFQLNLVWPDPEELKRYLDCYPDDTLVLQIGSRAMREVEYNPDKLVSKLQSYYGVVDRVLLDPSGGQGRPFDPEVSLRLLRAVENDLWHDFQLGVAGGLGPDRLEHLRSVLMALPNISIDAEGQLQDEQHQLNIMRVAAYLKQVGELLR